MTHNHPVRLLLLAILLLLHPAVARSADAAPAKDASKEKDKKSNLADAYFEGTNIPIVRIDIAPDKVAILRKYHFRWRGEEAMPRESVPATVKSGDQVWTNVWL